MNGVTTKMAAPVAGETGWLVPRVSVFVRSRSPFLVCQQTPYEGHS